MVISGRSRRVGSRGAEREGLTSDQVAAARADAVADAVRQGKDERKAGQNVGDGYYRRHRTRPLLLVHLIEPEVVDPQGTKSQLPSLVALHLGFPNVDGEPAGETVIYRINLTAARELAGHDIEPDDDEYDSEDEA